MRCRELEARVIELEGRLRDLEAKLKPPTTRADVVPEPSPDKKPTGKKQGAQKGHKPHQKTWAPPEKVHHFVHHVPKRCSCCDKALSQKPGPDDPAPTIHQVTELPKIAVIITEHQGHYRTCSCGHLNHAAIPAEVRHSTVGPNLAATMSYFAGSHGMSKRGIQETVGHKPRLRLDFAVR
ncbi:MAG: hypothetical protein ACRC8S_12150 [Fimbriiglobus sp.]